MMAIDKGESPIFRAHVTTEEERLVREFILQLKLGPDAASPTTRKSLASMFSRNSPLP